MKKAFLLLTLAGVMLAGCVKKSTPGEPVVDVTGVALNKTELTLAVGETETLEATVAPENATNKKVAWNSSKESVATVDASTGKVTAVAAGEAIVTATTADGGNTASCTVTVTKEATGVAVTGVSLNKTELMLEVDEKETLVATVAPVDATDKEVAWSSSKESVATVDQDTGEVTAISAGEAVITVTTKDGGKTASCTVTVTEVMTELQRFLAWADKCRKVAGNIEGSDYNFTLKESIDLDGIDWKPIGVHANNCYMSVFDGGNHTISGLKVNHTADGGTIYIDYAGLFGVIGASGSVKNLTVSGSVKGNAYTGGIAGYNLGTITDCTTNVSIEGTGSYVGGVCGYNYNVVTDCNNKGVVEGAREYVGGICGYNGSQSEITGCDNTGAVEGTGRYVGGVCGYNYNAVTNCNNKGVVEGAREYVGGVCGSNARNISKCTNEGQVDGKHNSVGGICGHNLSVGSIADCVNSGPITGTGNGSVGGVCGSNTKTITGSSNSGKVKGTGNNSFGGVCGYNDGGSVTDCTNGGPVEGGSYNTGGVCGNNVKGTVERCHNTALVTGASDVGGVCGFNYKSDNIVATTRACTNSGKVTLTGNLANVGGICGGNTASYIIACVNTGEVVGVKADNNVGGICGRNNLSSYLYACVNGGKVTGVAQTTNIGSVCGMLAGYTPNCYWHAVSGGASKGIGTGTDNTVKLTATTWPSEDASKHWGLVSNTNNPNVVDGGKVPGYVNNNPTNGGYWWSSLGSWNGGNPTLPVFWAKK